MKSRLFKAVKDAATPINLLKAYNALTACIVLNQYLEDPKASAPEYLFDVCVHTLQVVVTPDSYLATKLASLAGNTGQMASIVYHYMKGDSTIPALANGIDFVLNHPMNIARNLRDLGYDGAETVKSGLRAVAMASG